MDTQLSGASHLAANRLLSLPSVVSLLPTVPPRAWCAILWSSCRSQLSPLLLEVFGRPTPALRLLCTPDICSHNVITWISLTALPITLKVCFGGVPCGQKLGPLGLCTPSARSV